MAQLFENVHIIEYIFTYELSLKWETVLPQSV